MKKVIALASAVVVLSLSLIACSPGNEVTREITYDEFMKDQEISWVTTANVGDTIVITLGSNPTTGFNWPDVAQIYSQEILKQTDHEFIEPEQTGVVGAAGKSVWTFKALKNGITTVSMEYRRPWESGEDAEWTFKAIITVQ